LNFSVGFGVSLASEPKSSYWAFEDFEQALAQRSETSPSLTWRFLSDIAEHMRSEGDIPNGVALTRGNSPIQVYF
jgi:hypothetical protein